MKMNRLWRWLLLAIPLAVLTNQAAYAESQPRVVGNYDSWQAVTFFDNSTRSCMISNQSINSKAALKKNKQLGNGFFFISNWPGRREYLALSARAPVLLNPSRKGWLLFPDDSRFALIQSKIYVRPQPQMRAKILQMLRKQKNVQMVVYDKNNQEIRADFSLKGLEHALSALVKYCPLPR